MIFIIGCDLFALVSSGKPSTLESDAISTNDDQCRINLMMMSALCFWLCVACCFVHESSAELHISAINKNS